MNNQYSNNYNRNNYGPQPYGPQPQPKKKSGCKKGVGKNGQDYISAWNASKSNGLMKMIASRSVDKKTGEILVAQDKTGTKFYELYTCWITVGKQAPYPVTGFFNPQTNKLRIPKLNMTASPGRNYFGASIRKRS